MVTAVKGGLSRRESSFSEVCVVGPLGSSLDGSGDSSGASWGIARVDRDAKCGFEAFERFSSRSWHVKQTCDRAIMNATVIARSFY